MIHSNEHTAAVSDWHSSLDRQWLVYIYFSVHKHYVFGFSFEWASSHLLLPHSLSCGYFTLYS